MLWLAGLMGLTVLWDRTGSLTIEPFLRRLHGLMNSTVHVLAAETSFYFGQRQRDLDIYMLSKLRALICIAIWE